MWNTFRYTLKSLITERGVIIWVIIFPLVLSTLFDAAFANLESRTFKLDPIPCAVVEDAAFEDAGNTAFGQMVEALDVSSSADVADSSSSSDSAGVAGSGSVSDSADVAGSGSTADSADATTDGLLNVTYVENVAEAEGLINDGSILGYYVLDEDGTPSVVVAPVHDTNTMDAIDETVLSDIANEFIHARATIMNVLAQNSSLAIDPSFIEGLYERAGYTEQVSITANPSAESIRYFYALLGFAAIMAAMIALQAVVRTQPNLSTVGARRALGAVSRRKTLVGTLLACWLLAFSCLLLAYAYMRFVLGIDFGGRDAACILGILVASLMTTALGAMIGAIPKIADGAKGGILTAIACFLSMFAGLYGTPSLSLADQVARAVPWLASMNPVKKVADLFYSLYFYTSYEPFTKDIFILLVTAGIFTVIAALLMRRQRYASL